MKRQVTGGKLMKLLDIDGAKGKIGKVKLTFILKSGRTMMVYPGNLWKSLKKMTLLP